MSDDDEIHVPPKDEEAYRRFIQRLGKANAIFQDMSDRDGVHAAARAVWRYIEEGNLRLQLANPFKYVAEAMFDLKRGVQHPLFSDDPESIERSHSIRKKHLIAILAALLEVKFRDGQRLSDASIEVARAANLWPELSGQIISATTIRDWRYEARKPDFIMHDGFVEMVDYLMRLDPAERASEVKRSLREGPPDSVSFSK